MVTGHPVLTKNTDLADKALYPRAGAGRWPIGVYRGTPAGLTGGPPPPAAVRRSGIGLS
jgi:hypothetical protein